MSFVGDICGFEFPGSQEREFDGQQLCSNCLNIHTLLCRECGQRFWRTDNAGTEELSLCPSCYEEHYTTCHRCHRLVRESEVYYGTTDAGERCTYCERCFHIVDQDTRNHPFLAPAGTGSFALAHNGVIRNDRLLRKQEQLPATKIETDSYIAVQLLARSGEVSMDSLRDVAERLEGSFSFTVLDDQNNLYFVKGDSPLCLYHYQTSGVYLYASTKQILEKALQQLFFDWEPPIQVPLECGEILQITADGEEGRETFDDSKLLRSLAYGRYTPPSWWGVGSSAHSAESGHLAALKSVAGYFGIAPWEIDRLMEAGFTEEEIEEYLYRTEV